jgi:putative transposase
VDLGYARVDGQAGPRPLRPHLEDGVALVHAAREAGVSERTAQRWLARYCAGELVGLAAAPRSDRGGRRMPDELVAVIEGMALRRLRPSAATVHRRALQVAERNG